MESTSEKINDKSFLIFLLYLIPILGYFIISTVEAYTFEFFLNGPIFFLFISQIICSIIIGVKIGKNLVGRIFLPLVLIIGFYFLSVSFLPPVNQIQIPVFSYRCNTLFDYNELENFRVGLETDYKNGDILLEEGRKGYRRPFSYRILQNDNAYIKENFNDVGYYLRDGEIRYLIFFVAESKYSYAILWYPEKDELLDSYGNSAYRLFTDTEEKSSFYPLN